MSTSAEDSEDETECSKLFGIENGGSGDQESLMLSKNDIFLQFLAIFSFSLFVGLFILQANIAMRSYQSIYQLTRNRHSEDLIDLYFDSPSPWGLDSKHVDLKVNTSIFVH